MTSNLTKIKGDNNSVFQNAVLNNPTFVINPSESVRLLAAEGKYDAIQALFQQQLKQIEQVHPLSNYFTVTPVKIGDITKLISTPKTADALLKYPKSIKAKVTLDKSEYPGIGEDESPIEYAYRTQRQINVDTFEHKEFLGEIEDPFPSIKTNGASMILVPPKFPDPLNITVISGNCMFNATIQRIPSDEYKVLAFLVSAFDMPISIKLFIHEDSSLTKFSLSYKETSMAEHILAGENFLQQLRCSGKIELKLDGEILFSTRLSDTDVANDFFTEKPEMVRFLENLIKIEKQTGCRFNYSGCDLQWNDYVLSHILVASLNSKPHLHNIDFESFHVDRSKISTDSLNIYPSEKSLIFTECMGSEFDFYGVSFSFDKYISYYQNARVNNLTSVMKNIKRKKERILITLKPINTSIGKIKNFRIFKNLQITNHD